MRGHAVIRAEGAVNYFLQTRRSGKSVVAQARGDQADSSSSLVEARSRDAPDASVERTTWERIPRKCDWSPLGSTHSHRVRDKTKRLKKHKLLPGVYTSARDDATRATNNAGRHRWRCLVHFDIELRAFDPGSSSVTSLWTACEHSRDLIGPDREPSLAQITKSWCGTNEGCGNHPSCLVLECEMIKSGVGVCKRSRPVERTVWETSMRARRMATRE